MTDTRVIHSTFTIERDYPYAPEKVFAAFADPVKKRRWFAEGEGFIIDQYDLDFREGGIESARFRTSAPSGPIPAGTVFKNYTTYHDIVPNRRIVSVYSMLMGEARISTSLATVELRPTATGTQVLLTEQGAYLDGADGPQLRKEGWIALVDALGRELADH